MPNLPVIINAQILLFILPNILVYTLIVTPLSNLFDFFNGYTLFVFILNSLLINTLLVVVCVYVNLYYVRFATYVVWGYLFIYLFLNEKLSLFKITYNIKYTYLNIVGELVDGLIHFHPPLFYIATATLFIYLLLTGVKTNKIKCIFYIGFINLIYCITLFSGGY